MIFPHFGLYRSFIDKCSFVFCFSRATVERHFLESKYIEIRFTKIIDVVAHRERQA